jgi:Flp pilus assembly protein TadG
MLRISCGRRAAIEVPRRRLSRRPAAASVEFAVVGLAFVPVLLGIIEIGRGLMVAHVLQVASARGCRTAALESNSDTEVKAAVNTTCDGAGISGQNVTVQVNNATANCNTANAGDEVTVIVSIPFGSISWVPGAKYLSGNISAQYTLTRE